MDVFFAAVTVLKIFTSDGFVHFITETYVICWRKKSKQKCTENVHKNIERHTADTIVLWPKPKQWVIVSAREDSDETFAKTMMFLF